jgi:hypothetical protein
MTEDDADLAAPFGRAAGNRQRWPSSGSGRSAGSNSSAGSSGGATAETARPTTSSDLVFKCSFLSGETTFFYRSVYFASFCLKTILVS